MHQAKSLIRLYKWRLIWVLARCKYYHIRPNNRTVHLCFSKLLETLSCGKICTYLLRIHCKKDQERTYLKMIMWCFFRFSLLRHMLWVLIWIASTCRCNSNEFPQHMSLWEVDKKYTFCHLKTTELLDCALIGVCAVIRSNTVCHSCPWYCSDSLRDLSTVCLLLDIPRGSYMTVNPLKTEWTLPYNILEDSNFNFRYVRLCDLDVHREKWLNYLQMVETLIRTCFAMSDLGLHCLCG